MNKKQKFIILIVFIVTLIVVVSSLSFIINSNSLKKYTASNISFKYDSNWNISKNGDNIYLVNKDGSGITITVAKLDDATMNMSIEDINSGVIAKLMGDNKNYKKIAEQKIKMTSVYYDGYKTLLEDSDNQALVYVCSTSDYILVVNYGANNKYFDMSLDSVESIVGSIAI